MWAAITGEQPGWSLEALLLADIYGVLAGKPHPAREKSIEARSKSGRHAKDHRARLRQQRARTKRQG